MKHMMSQLNTLHKQTRFALNVNCDLQPAKLTFLKKSLMEDITKF
jgi:hypothetical protein